MTTSTRLRGNSALICTMKKGAAAAVSYADDIKKFELTFEEKDDDDLTFAEAAGGTGSDAVLKITAIVSYDAGSLYAFLFDNPGSDVEIVLGPWGNAAPTATKPHFKGTANTGLRPPISNEAAAASKAKGAEFEVELKYSTDITKVTA